MSPRKKLLATRLRAARERVGLSQARVAGELGLHRPSVSEMEAGHRNVLALELLAMAGLYGVAVGWLLGEGEEPPP